VDNIPEFIAYSLRVLKVRREALAELPASHARDTILASLDEMIAFGTGRRPF
jgi:hypothetical protein